jgi:hypothetical protein
MQVPNDWPKPVSPSLAARAQVGFCAGVWIIYDSTGHIITQYMSPFLAARHVNTGSRPS